MDRKKINKNSAFISAPSYFVHVERRLDRFGRRPTESWSETSIPALRAAWLSARACSENRQPCPTSGARNFLWWLSRSRLRLGSVMSRDRFLSRCLYGGVWFSRKQILFLGVFALPNWLFVPRLRPSHSAPATSLWSIWVRLFARTRWRTWSVWAWRTSSPSRNRPRVDRRILVRFLWPAQCAIKSYGLNIVYSRRRRSVTRRKNYLTWYLLGWRRTATGRNTTRRTEDDTSWWWLDLLVVGADWFRWTAAVFPRARAYKYVVPCCIWSPSECLIRGMCAVLYACVYMPMRSVPTMTAADTLSSSINFSKSRTAVFILLIVFGHPTSPPHVYHRVSII